MKIKELSVTVTYTACLGDIDVSEEIYKELIKAFEEGETINSGEKEYANANDWLADNIQEKDAMNWEIEIDDLITTKTIVLQVLKILPPPRRENNMVHLDYREPETGYTYDWIMDFVDNCRYSGQSGTRIGCKIQWSEEIIEKLKAAGINTTWHDEDKYKPGHYFVWWGDF